MFIRIQNSAILTHINDILTLGRAANPLAASLMFGKFIAQRGGLIETALPNFRTQATIHP
ncbi:MAG: hypothetical protein EBT95_06210 [Verrucomicrobia bacterium]|nr:hypothetical protein [Verrucomicrobiota bacterium]